jgi:hypothetical protein
MRRGTINQAGPSTIPGTMKGFRQLQNKRRAIIETAHPLAGGREQREAFAVRELSYPWLGVDIGSRSPSADYNNRLTETTFHYCWRVKGSFKLG